MKKIFLSALMLGTVVLAGAQTKDGGISPAMLKQIQQQTAEGPAVKALQNAIQNNSIDLLAKGPAQRGQVPTEFSIDTRKQSITNQKSSGRCWMFSGLNVLRNDFALANEGKVVTFSQDYLFFWDQLEKSNLMLQGIIDTANKDAQDPEVQFFFQSPIGDGGTFCGVIDLVSKYGLVPTEVMPETFTAENTSRMGRLLSSKLREYALKLRKMVAEGKSASDVKAEKTQMLKTIYGMLCMAYGTPVTEFTYAHHDKDGKTVGEAKKYTPMSFAQECGATKLKNTYIMVMNDPRNEYNKVYEIQYDRHTYDGSNWRYLNLPMEEIEKLAIAALKDGKKMYSSYDVGKFLDRARGFASLDNYDYGSLFMTEFPMTKAERLLTRDSGSTHAMTLSAVNLDANTTPTAWKVENSWGADSGQKGCLVMTADWFREFMFRLVVDKKYASKDILKLAEQKPIMLKYDDALFEDNF